MCQVVRSRLQEQGLARDSANHYKGVIDCTKQVFQKEGIPGFYRGCATNLLRTTPAAVITFTSYEMIQRFLHRVLPPEQKHSEDHTESGSKIKSWRNTDSGEQTTDESIQTPQRTQLTKRELATGH